MFTQSEVIAGLFDLAPGRLAIGDQQFVDGAIRRLSELPVRAVQAGAEVQLVHTVATLWSGGWQPTEVARQVRRAGSANLAQLALVVIAADHAIRPLDSLDPRWAEQLAELGLPHVTRSTSGGSAAGWFGEWAGATGIDLATQVTIVIELVNTMRALPRIAELIPPPGGATRGRQQPTVRSDAERGVLHRVRSLLVKAESTTFDAEAEAFTAKAHELMTRHAIDVAMLDVDDDHVDEMPVTIRIAIDDPYLDAKSLLLQVVAAAGRCRGVFHDGLAMSSVVGFRADVDAVEMLFTSLLVQAQSALGAAARRAAPGSRPRSRSFRAAFLLAYANRIGQRLDEINDALIAEAEASTGREVLPALRSREGLVDQAIADQFSSLGDHRVSGGRDAAGWAHGRLAAESAQLSFGSIDFAATQV